MIEMYPGFGLLSTRVMKKEPLSYTFVEPDKRVVKSLQRCAQAGEVRVFAFFSEGFKSVETFCKI